MSTTEIITASAPRDSSQPRPGTQPASHAGQPQATPAPPPPPPHDPHDESAVPTDLPVPSSLQVVVAVSVFALLLLTLFVIGYIPHHRAVKQAEADAESHKDAGVVVAVIRPVSSSGESDIKLPCDVKANQTTAIYTRTNGYLKKWNFDIQDKVKAGQILAEIEAPEVDAQLAQTKATLEQDKAAVIRSEADLKLAKVTLDRYIQAQKTSPGSVTQEDLDTKQSAYDDAAAALLQARANVVAAQANVQQLAVTQGFQKIVAPFSGLVTARNYDIGALLSPTNTGPGKEIFDLAQVDTLRVFVNVPQTYATNIRTGQDAYLQVRNFPDREFKGTVTRTSGSLDQTTRTLSVQIDFPNKEGTLYAGMYGQVRLPISAQSPVMMVPTSAMMFDAKGLQVATVNDGKLHIKNIKVGRDLGTQIEVTQGLAADDSVVTNPGQDMSEGMNVEVKQATLPAAPRPAATAEAAPADQRAKS